MADAGQFKKAAAIIASRSCSCYVVVSAPGKRFPGDEKVTDLLFRCADLAEAGQDALPLLHRVFQRFETICRELRLSLSLQEDFQSIEQALLHSCGTDYLVSRGEYLCSRILAAYLGYPMIDAANGIRFTRDGALDKEATYARLSVLLKEVPCAVIPGFYGGTSDGQIRTFSRGGSDITGAIVARAADAELYENWTDVSGIRMADPAIVQDAQIIPQISYDELHILTHMGASVFHEDAVAPVREAGIPVNIRNTNAPDEPGTMILPTLSGTHRSAGMIGLAGKTGYSALTVQLTRPEDADLCSQKLLSILNDCQLTKTCIPAGIGSSSLLLPTALLRKKQQVLAACLMQDDLADTVVVHDGLALLTVVACQLEACPSMIARVLTAVSRHGIVVRMVNQSYQGDHILLGIGAADYPAATQAIYEEFAS